MNEYKVYEDEIKKIFELDKVSFDKEYDLSLYFVGIRDNIKLRFRLVEAGNRLYEKINGTWEFKGRLINGQLVK